MLTNDLQGWEKHMNQPNQQHKRRELLYLWRRGPDLLPSKTTHQANMVEAGGGAGGAGSKGVWCAD